MCIRKSLGQIIRVSAAMHVLFHLDSEEQFLSEEDLSPTDVPPPNEDSDDCIPQDSDDYEDSESPTNDYVLPPNEDDSTNNYV